MGERKRVATSFLREGTGQRLCCDVAVEGRGERRVWEKDVRAFSSCQRSDRERFVGRAL